MTARSLPTPEQIEVAEGLSRLAQIELATTEKLAPDPEIDDRPVGFHAQQAVEKAVKAALTLKGIDFPKTHDLDYLISLTVKHSIALDPEFASATWLTPWAAEFRYDDAPMDTLDRKRAVTAASAAVDWSQELLANQSKPPESESDESEADKTA